MRRRVSLWLIAGALLASAGVLLGITRTEDNPLSAFFRRDLTWQGMQHRGTWRIGMDPSFPPFETLDANGSAVGMDVDLAQRLASAWDMEIEVIAIGFDSLPDALKAGKIDSIVSAYPYDERLTRDFIFSTPYFDAGLRLAVRETEAIEAIGDLAGKQVAVEWGSMGDMVGRRLQREGTDVTLVRFETPEAVVEALQEQDDIDAALVDNVTLRQAQAMGAALRAVGDPIEGSPYVIVMPARASDLASRVEETLDQLRSDGSLADLEKKWFSATLQAGE